MNNNFGKTLEQTIKELRARYKNVPSPLSENYNKFREQRVPQQTTPGAFHNKLLGDFKPTKRQW